MGLRNDIDVFSPNQYENVYYEAPVVAKRAPTANDKLEIGKVWIDTVNDDAYFLTSISSGSAVWINAGGGTGTFSSITATTGNITATLGDFVASAGDLNIAAGSVTFGILGIGVVQSSAAGLLSSSAGTDGQVLIGSTGLAPSWSTLTAGGGITIVEGAGTITISNPGATGSTFGTDAGGPVSPTGGGLTTFEGYDANITTDGATANTVRIRLADDVTTVGALTAGANLGMTSGTCTIISNDNSPQSIYLHADEGAAETISLHSDQGTSVSSIELLSDVGGLSLTSGLASADAININASDAAGGIDIDFGTGGLSVVGANGAINLESGTGAINVGVDAAAHTVTVGSTNTTAATVIQSGSGDVAITSTDAVTVDSAGVLELNSSAGIIGIGNDAVAQNINIGTGAAARTLTLGNGTGATSVVVNCGTGALNLGTNAVAHTSTLGSTTGAAATTVQAGTGALTLTAGGIFDVNATGAVTIDTAAAISIDSSASTIGIGTDDVDQAVNIATDGERTTTIGSNNGAAGVVIDCGTGNASFGATATAHSTTIGSTNTTSNLVLQTGSGSCVGTFGGTLDINGTGDITVDAGSGIFDLSVSGNITLDSSGGTIGIGVDDIDQNINIGTTGERTITIGNQVGAAGIVIESGTSAMALNASGLISVEPATDTQAAAAVTINANAGVGTFTGLTTAAAAKQTLTITNSICTASSAILASVSNLGANDAKMNIERITPGAGSFTVDVINSGAASLNGNIILTFWIIKP